jgi:hypothetical protein
MATQTQVFTFTTEPGSTTPVRRALPNEWLEMTLRLETAGPVAIGHLEDLGPAGSGKGRLLPQGADVIVKLSPGSSLYVFSASVDRVSIHINAIPGLDELLAAIGTKQQKTSAQATSSQPNLGSFGFNMPGKK